MWKKEKQAKKRNDRGSALITVVVVTAFISILATIILYAAGMNYNMKAADKKNKDSFYEAEKVMESIKAGLVPEAMAAFQEAYKETAIAFGRLSADDRRSLYNQTFTDTLKTNFDAHVDATSAKTLEAYITSLVPDSYLSSSTNNHLTVGAADLDLHADAGYALLKDVVLKYEKDGYYTQIKTDFMIKIPKIDWSIDTAPTGGGDDPQDLQQRDLGMTDCVIYYNWEKQ
ncbi:MAG: hypothetical protein NC251_00050 [Lachnoclostridium sp.]|nr:hypothetical protein [Lachnospira sp.]MCM1246807.1 hypothetical protein [Lachnoclostridium sp.]MCM1535406.1 hypothetical protein [Clostridium sp.]